MDPAKAWRKTSQQLAPARNDISPNENYALYPDFPLGGHKIKTGYASLAQELAKHRQIVIDGYGGVFWENLRRLLDEELNGSGLTIAWHDVSSALRPPAEIEALVAPFIGGDDPLFGTRFTGNLDDFFDESRLAQIKPDPRADINILYGCGAALAGWQGLLCYVDVPKNEIQFRSRAGSISNLGVPQTHNPKLMYKRFYFIDWVALNKHKASVLPKIEIIIDGQRPIEPGWMSGDDLREALHQMAHNYFRARPWFEPGPWGGQWIKKHIPDLSQDVPNYAWSFELISPENGLAFESDGNLLEVSFDFLMFQEFQAVTGRCAECFGFEFPIRYDFLDTFAGGNLSIQVHPGPDYIKRNFGETFTQDEAYYILDAVPGAQVYLGFKEDIDPARFRNELERSFREQTPLAVERFVEHVPSHKHDLFLIPNGTVHGSGKDNLVLEISATPYIFTFKMYDWMRPDLDGKPRTLNIERAFDNLNFERKGARVNAELVSTPETIAQGNDWKVVHLPTHPEHFYDVHRLEFDTEIEVDTDESCHVLMVVEGEAVRLITAQGLEHDFHYAETFIIPAAARTYKLINLGNTPVKVVKAFIKQNAC